MAVKQNAPQKGNGNGRVFPRSWSQNPFLKKGPLHRFFYMGRTTRRIFKEAVLYMREGDLEGAFAKFLAAASRSNNSAFSADLHEMAGDTMLEMSRKQFDNPKINACLETAAGEYKSAASKCSGAEPERAAKLYGMAGEFFHKSGVQGQARECYALGSNLTTNQAFRNFLTAKSESL
ncbi:MAG: hypothetical protein ACLFUZ_03895 [Candidatus Micrarchaeia archaeon]